MGKALPFPMHKHPPRGAGLLSKAGSAASQTTSAVGEDQGAAGDAADAGEVGEEGAPPATPTGGDESG